MILAHATAIQKTNQKKKKKTFTYVYKKLQLQSNRDVIVRDGSFVIFFFFFFLFGTNKHWKLHPFRMECKQDLRISRAPFLFVIVWCMISMQTEQLRTCEKKKKRHRIINVLSCESMKFDLFMSQSFFHCSW